MTIQTFWYKIRQDALLVTNILTQLKQEGWICNATVI